MYERNGRVQTKPWVAAPCGQEQPRNVDAERARSWAPSRARIPRPAELWAPELLPPHTFSQCHITEPVTSYLSQHSLTAQVGHQQQFLPRKGHQALAEPPALEVFREPLDVALGDKVWISQG